MYPCGLVLFIFLYYTTNFGINTSLILRFTLNNILVSMMDGWGDSIYNRAFVKILAKDNNVYLKTVLPRIFMDIENVYFIDPKKDTFRTQQKQKNKEEIVYTKLPNIIHKELTPYYTGKDLIEGSIVSYFYKAYDIPTHTKLEWDLPDFSKDLAESTIDIPKDRKIAIIRPSTIRAEWHTETRNAKQHYLAWCCKILNDCGYYTISIADLEPRKEWLADNVDIPAQLILHKSELGMYGTLELIKNADLVIAGSGFCVPATVSTNTNLFIIFGGRMGFDCLSKITHPTMDMKKIGWAMPDNPCRCTESIHDCDKTITHLESDFYKFLKEIQ